MAIENIRVIFKLSYEQHSFESKSTTHRWGVEYAGLARGWQTLRHPRPHTGSDVERIHSSSVLHHPIRPHTKSHASAFALVVTWERSENFKMLDCCYTVSFYFIVLLYFNGSLGINSVEAEYHTPLLKTSRSCREDKLPDHDLCTPRNPGFVCPYKYVYNPFSYFFPSFSLKRFCNVWAISTQASLMV